MTQPWPPALPQALQGGVSAFLYWKNAVSSKLLELCLNSFPPPHPLGAHCRCSFQTPASQRRPSCLPAPTWFPGACPTCLLQEGSMSGVLGAGAAVRVLTGRAPQASPAGPLVPRDREKPGSRAQTDGTWQLLGAMRKLPTPGTNR